MEESTDTTLFKQFYRNCWKIFPQESNTFEKRKYNKSSFKYDQSNSVYWNGYGRGCKLRGVVKINIYGASLIQ